VSAGGRFEVSAKGPNGAQDFVSIDRAGAPEKTYGPYAYVAKGPTLSLRAPDEPGDYELRYHTGQTYKVLGARPITVDDVTATVTAPASVVAGRVFEAQWTGPNNEDDFITVVAPTAKDKESGPSNGYTKRGNPARIEAPKSAGAYELRYLTGQSRRVLARAPLTVTADATPGKLHVIRRDGSAAAPSIGAVELVLDASGSMLQRIGGERRIDLAKKAFIGLVNDVLAPGTPFALRVFGHKEADSCRTDLEIPVAPLDRATVAARIQALEAKNLAKTPIADSLAKVKADLAGAKAPLLVVLVTDGEETCGGDPRAAIEALRAAGVETRVSIVGFAIDDVALREAFQDWARAGGGGYFDADDGAELSAAVRAAFRETFEVSAGSSVIATGTVGADPITVPAGTYRVAVRGAGERDLGEVTIVAGETRELSF
jgi:Mg-chelatase subunit ChlD